MGIERTTGRSRLFLIWLVATLLWTAAATAFFPLREAATAIRRNAPNAAEQVSMFNEADKSFWLCMQQQPSAIEDTGVTRDRARESRCNALKDFLYGEIVGMPRDWAWGHVGRFAAATLAGALSIAALLFVASWLIPRPHRVPR